MKKLSVLIAVCSMLLALNATSQPTLLTHVTFNDGKIPANWTASNSTYVGIAPSDLDFLQLSGNFVRLLPSEGSDTVYLESPEFTIDANKDARLEFNHIPMLDASAGGFVYLVTSKGTQFLGQPGAKDPPVCYDATYGGGIKSSFSDGKFYKGRYWDSDVMQSSDFAAKNTSFWKHEVFYLSNNLNGETTFKLKFAIPNKKSKDVMGWLIDDIKVFVASSTGTEVRIPQITSTIKYPDMKLYPLCGDAEFSFNIKDAAGLSSVADSIYLEYQTIGGVKGKSVFQNMGSNIYTATMPFAGVDSMVYWRVVVNDEAGNVTTFPFTGVYDSFVFVRPYVGSDLIGGELSTSSEEFIFKTSSAKLNQQFLYSAKELREAGYAPGRIAGFYVYVKSSPTTPPVLSNFKMYVAKIDTSTELNATSSYKNTLCVINTAEYTTPENGWQYIEFDPAAEFLWDGESDILIRVCFDGNTSSEVTKVASMSTSSRYETKQYAGSSGSTQVACTADFTKSMATKTKPQLRFNFVDICYFETDAGINKEKIISPGTANDCNGSIEKTVLAKSGTASNLTVLLRNDGTQALNSVKVSWMIDNDPSTVQSSTWTGNMKPLDDEMNPVDTAVTFTASTSFNPPEGIYNFKIWTDATDLSKNIKDWNYLNDTAEFKLIVTNGQMSGNYAIGGDVSGIDSKRTFATLDDAFLMLQNAGVNGPVTFKIKPHSENLDYYKGQWAFPKCIQGLSAQNTLTFESSNENEKVTFVPKSENSLYLFDLGDLKYVTLRNIHFVPSIAQGENDSLKMVDVVKLGANSGYVTFDSCVFSPIQSTDSSFKVNRLLFLSSASNITVNNCTFDYPAETQLQTEGLSPSNTNTNVRITSSTFNITGFSTKNSTFTNIYSRYSNNLLIEGNTFVSLLSPDIDSSLQEIRYVVSLSDAKNAEITKNIFTLKSSSAISFSEVSSSVIANNRISLWYANKTSANFPCYGINVISGEDNTIVYNNVYTRSSVSATKKAYGMALGYAGLSVKNNVVKNNIILNEGYGSSINLRPSESNSKESFDISNNMYYKIAANNDNSLFSYNGTSSVSVYDWKVNTLDTNSIYDQNPIFYAWDNLLTTNTSLCEAGTYIEGGAYINDVTDDCFGHTRPTSTSGKLPCIGAEEFDPPLNNIYVVSVGVSNGNFDGNNTFTACDFGKDSVYVTFKNISAETIEANKVKFNYSINGLPSSEVTFTSEMIPDSTYYLTFPVVYDFSAENETTTEFSVKAWSICDLDIVKHNDTASAFVVSLYQKPATAPKYGYLDYATSTTISVASQDSVYWYYSMNDDNYFFKGHSFESPVLYADTTFYFSVKSEVPILKITEIQVSKDATKEGITDKLPKYIKKDNAYEISNLGNSDMNLSGYSFEFYKTSKTELPAKASSSFSFPDDYILKPNTSLLLIPDKTLKVDSSIALSIPNNITNNSSAKVGFIIRDNNNTIIDAVTINGATFASSLNVPTSIWTNTAAASVLIEDVSTAGIIRNKTNTTSSEGWTVADANHKMTIGSYNNELTVAKDNGCYGFKTPYNLVINEASIPNFDPGLSEIHIEGRNDDSAFCTMSNEKISVTITNTGIHTLENIPIKCEFIENNEVIETFEDIFAGPIEQWDTMEYTFENSFDFSATTTERDITIRTFVDYDGDIKHANDTLFMHIISGLTPIPPIVSDTSVNYADSAHLTAISEDIVVWFDNDSTMNELARGDLFTAPLYENDTFYVSSLLQSELTKTIGEDSIEVSSSGSAAYPSPFNAANKKVKEQYMLRASDLSLLGYGAGNISQIAFKIKSVEEDSVILTDYSVKIGIDSNPSLTSFATNGMTDVYLRDSIIFTPDSVGWKNIIFDEPFFWDGISNIVIQVCFSSEGGSVITYNTSTDYTSALSYRHNTNEVCSWSGSAIGEYTSLPYMQLSMDVFGCHSERKPVFISVENTPDCDGAILDILTDGTLMSNVDMPIYVVLKNFGKEPLTTASISYNINDGNSYSTPWTGSIASGMTDTVELDSHVFSAGTSIITAIVNIDCDNIHSNDTMMQNVTACLGNNTSVTEFYVSKEESADYHTINEALTDITSSGICGPIILNLSDDTYDEQISISQIEGASQSNTITIKANSNESVIITSTSDASDPTILVLDGANGIHFENIIFKSDAKSIQQLAHINSTTDIEFRGTSFIVPQKSSTVENLVTLTGFNNNIIFIGDTFRYANTAIAISQPTEEGYSKNVLIDSCTFENQTTTALVINSYENMTINYNTISSVNPSNEFIAMSINGIKGDATIEGNRIHVTDATKNTNGMLLQNISMADVKPIYVKNNEIALISQKQSIGLGINISQCENAYVYYNTVLIKSQSNQTKSKAINIEQSASGIMVRNNIFENRAGGYAYYVDDADDAGIVSLSNNNSYYTSGNTLAYWSSLACATLTDLQTLNEMDASSVSLASPFVSDTYLRLLYPNDVVRAAEPLEDVVIDITGRMRSVTPKPTMGAYEYIFSDVDAGIVEILEPVTSSFYVEHDPIYPKVIVKNFGNFGFSKIKMVAELHSRKYDKLLDKIEDELDGFMASLDTVHYVFPNALIPPLNSPLEDSLCLAVYSILENDTVNVNDTVYMNIKVIPAKDIVIRGIDNQSSGLARCGRNMRNQTISIKFANDGEKALDASDAIVLTYEVYDKTKKTKFTSATETLTFPYTYQNAAGTSITVTNLPAHSNNIPYTFSTTCDLYPTGYNDTTWQIIAYARMVADSNFTNDTSDFKAYESRISPNAPAVTNDTIFYSTWGHPQAGHIDKLPIKWYLSESDASAFYAPSQYAQSTMYTTDTLFNDTSFFVRVESKTGIPCPSDFAEVKVIIKDRCATDLSPLRIFSEPYIFMQNDTVKVAIVNRGTSPQTNFNVTYSLKPTGSTGSPTEVTETCLATILPDQVYVFSFETLFDFTSADNWDAVAWVDIEGDCTPLNDTTAVFKITPIPNNDAAPVIKDPISLDITRVQLANLDNTSLAFADSYSDFTSSVEPAILFRGMKDSLLILSELASMQEKPEKTILTGWMKAWIDWNRDGIFDDNELVYNDTVIPNVYNRTEIETPDSANTGHTRMRIILAQNDAEHSFGPYPGKLTSALGSGEIEDYKLLIRPTEPINGDLMRIVTPERTTNQTHQNIVVRLRNSGYQPLTNATITWYYNDSDTLTYEWSGNLAKSEITDITLATLDLPYGYNHFKMWLDVEGDTYSANDTLERETNIYHTYVFNYATNFDEPDMANNDFYAYEISLAQPTNCWEFGTPNDTVNQYITSAYSKPYCWKTRRSGHYPKNNTSLLYSPIFDISDIKPDSMSFMIRKAMGKDAYLTVEYMNYAGSWVKLGSKDTMWYDTDDGFAGTNSGWTRATYSLDKVSGDFGKVLQIRFVFKSSDANTSEGVAIDNFEIKRTLRPEDVGVDRIELTPDRLPNYGQYFYPKVDIINYGKGLVDEFQVCYFSEDMYIPQCEEIKNAGLKPQDTLTYTFKHGHYLDASMPDPFTVTAYTRLTPGDLYKDNDTARLTCVIGPLMYDAALVNIIEPVGKSAANNDAAIKIKVRNYGLKAIDTMNVGFASDDGTYVIETIKFNPPLYNGDDYIYTFNNTFNIPFGSSTLRVWTELTGDNYLDNDTAYARIQGLANKMDLEADYITLDPTKNNDYGVQLVFTNHGNTAIKNITVGYFYNGDTNNKVEEMYRGGDWIEGGQTAYHMFTKRLPKGKEYHSLCAYVTIKASDSGMSLLGDLTPENDTTCNSYIGYHDGVIDSIMIEETAEPTALVQIRAHNGGTLGGTVSVIGKYVINGDWDNPNQQKFEWKYSEPRPDKVQYMTFSRRIPKSEDHKYDIVAWIEFPNDVNHSNDTTDYYNTYTYVSLDTVNQEEQDFILEQNKPNPFKDWTKIGFTLPQAGHIRFYVTNSSGQMIHSYENDYSSGHHIIDFDARDLEQGVYYYVLEFNGKRKSKKMINIE